MPFVSFNLFTSIAHTYENKVARFCEFNQLIMATEATDVVFIITVVKKSPSRFMIGH